MADVYVARFSRWLEKLFNVKGGPLVVDVSPEIQASVSLQPGVEERYLIGWNRFAAQNTAGPTAAQFSGIRFRNPLGSGVIAVFEKVTCLGGAATDQPRFGNQISNADFGSFPSVTNARLDARGNPQPSIIFSAGTQASIGAGAYIFGNVAINGNYEFIQTVNQEMPLLPGDTVTLWSNVVNQALNGSFMWRERALETSESS